MKTLYLECSMGAAGDMLMAALLELHPDPLGFIERMNALGIPGVALSAGRAAKCGVMGTHVAVTVLGEAEESHDVSPQGHTHDHGHEHTHAHDHAHCHEHHEHDEHNEQHEQHHHDAHHHHAGLREIEEIVMRLSIPEQVKRDALAVYGLIAAAESRAHGKPVGEVHFHEVGAMDAVADVVGVSLLLGELAPEKILASPIHVGSGQVRCAHGILPVPAPATAYILEGIPIYGGTVRGELCTPTGAALLKHFAAGFGPLPAMRVDKIGYGMGTKDFEAANCVRAMLGETQDSGETIVELCCNLDDLTPEAVGFATEELLAGGALDVYVTPVQMKKNRPGIVLTCMCRAARREEMLRLLFRHTTTLGVRESICNRYTLRREDRTVETECGPVRVKRAYGYGIDREKAEFEDLARIARAKGISLREAAKILKENRDRTSNPS